MYVCMYYIAPYAGQECSGAWCAHVLMCVCMSCILSDVDVTGIRTVSHNVTKQALCIYPPWDSESKLKKRLSTDHSGGKNDRKT